MALRTDKKGAGIMKKFIKIIGIISGIFAIIAVVLISIGAARGGIKIAESDFWNDRLSVGFGEWSDDDLYSKNMSEISDNMVNIKKEKNNINSIILKAKYGDVSISSWDNEDFGIDASDRDVSAKYEVKNNVLNISVRGKRGIFVGKTGRVKIYVPNTAIEKIDLSIGAGNLECNGISTKKLVVDVGAGECTLTSVNSEETNMKVGAGQGDITLCDLGICKFDVGMGEIDVESSTIKSAAIDCGMGSVDLELTNNITDFNYLLKVGAGEINIDDREYSGLSKKTTIDNGAENNIDIDCGMGEVNIEFK